MTASQPSPAAPSAAHPIRIPDLAARRHAALLAELAADALFYSQCAAEQRALGRADAAARMLAQAQSRAAAWWRHQQEPRA